MGLSVEGRLVCLGLVRGRVGWLAGIKCWDRSRVCRLHVVWVDLDVWSLYCILLLTSRI